MQLWQRVSKQKRIIARAPEGMTPIRKTSLIASIRPPTSAVLSVKTSEPSKARWFLSRMIGAKNTMNSRFGNCTALPHPRNHRQETSWYLHRQKTHQSSQFKLRQGGFCCEYSAVGGIWLWFRGVLKFLGHRNSVLQPRQKDWYVWPVESSC